MNDYSLTKLTLKQLIDGLEKKQFTISEVIGQYFDKINEQNKKYNIYLTINKQAESNALARVNKPLKGIPIAVKDNFLTQGIRTTASSKVLDNFIPAFHSTVTKRLIKNGGTIIGKTNMDAWAHGSSTETSDYGPTINPLNTEYSPGGSSGGSAAAISAELAPIAIGTETAGSIRVPASWNGIVGFKPTYGRVSRYGVVAMASSTDSPGPMSRTVEDSAFLLNYMAGYDPLDATSHPSPIPDYTSFLNKDIKDIKIGILYSDIKELKSIQKQMQQAYKVFERLGAKVEETKAMDPHIAIAVYTAIQRAEVSSNLARFHGIRMGNDRSYFGQEAKKRILVGIHTLLKDSKIYKLAQQVRVRFIQDFENLFEKYDVLIAPTSPGYALKIGESKKNPIFGELVDMLEEPSAIAGLPGISIPCYHDKKTNLYLGLNIIGPKFREDLIIQVADAYEKATSWNRWRK